jgi:arsenate reductase
MAKTTIYHNPRCAKSRETLKLLKDNGVDPEVIEYLKTPPDAAALKRLLKQLGLKPAELIRAKEYRALGLPETDDPAELVARMTAHPEIIERPIVVHGGKARLGRPPERVLEILK